VLLVLVTVGLNFLLYLGKNALANRHHLLNRTMGWVKESVAASEKILDTDYENLENPDFQKKARDYWQAMAARSTCFITRWIFSSRAFSPRCAPL
jgi:hypothetical protein